MQVSSQSVSTHLGASPCSLRCGDYRYGAEDPRTLGGIMRAGKQVVLPSQCNGTNSVFNEIIVNLNRSVLHEARQLLPPFQGIMHGDMPGTFLHRRMRGKKSL